MKCVECVAEGKRSKVNIGMTTVTAAGIHSFYDEDGNIHVHDPNIRSTQYSCSEGHTWTDQRRSECVRCDYGKE